MEDWDWFESSSLDRSLFAGLRYLMLGLEGLRTELGGRKGKNLPCVQRQRSSATSWPLPKKGKKMKTRPDTRPISVADGWAGAEMCVFTLFQLDHNDGPTDRQMDKASYRVACPQLKSYEHISFSDSCVFHA